MQTYLKKKFHPFQVGQKNRETLYKRYFELGEIVERDIEKNQNQSWWRIKQGNDWMIMNLKAMNDC